MLASRSRAGFRILVPSLLAALFLILAHDSECSSEGDIIGGWAETFGEELWDLGQRITKAPELKERYKKLHVRVEKKDGKQLLRSAVATVGRMLSRKMDAIRCIQVEAENLVEQSYYNDTIYNLTYYSAKFSYVEDGEISPDPKFANITAYLNMSLNADTHFYNISVNTTYSVVHVPTNVYDFGQEVAETIDWSRNIDDEFMQNYQSDPALSWQYFCSSTGMMRQYPAVAWTQAEGSVDLFDCRRRSWYIEAATCSKDVVILFDNSGSMAGYNNFVAKTTVQALLDTFSNNDFFTIISFSNDTYEVVPCFGDKLMQATPDNMRTFNTALAGLKKPDEHANFTMAFVKAFELLERYRFSRGCNDTLQSQGCNQAIMLITDGIPGNLTEVYEKYNRLNNATEIPVRIFTYLIGKEVTNVREIQWLACLNRGYYVHIQSLDEVQEMVLKYTEVIARPLVLQDEKHPITWTHAYTDITPSKKDPKAKYEKYRLMTSVAVPLYDKKANKNNMTRVAKLLGVAGTDVPIEEIDRLTLPYKLGVNGYSFIVSNNGYLLLHPDLRPVYKGILKENYNSVDVVEVEMIDDELGIHELGPEVLALREAMVGNSEGSIMNLKVRFHYDKMRRISRERQDYYYAPLPNTPFSLGIVLPHDYGNTWIKVGDEVKRNQHAGLHVEDFFEGDNWKIHPKWVYCKYHYLEGHEFKTPEDELLEFLKKMGEPNWKWSEQYEPEPELEDDDDDDDDDFDPERSCGRKTLDDNAYFCNKELVQLLVFDAKVTQPLYTIWKFKDDTEEQLFRRYNASLRFVATMSGLTRWQFVFGEDMNDTSLEFGDNYNEAIDEIWYKSAILQHQIEAESFSFSVPFDSASKSSDEIMVTASHAVFPRDGGLQAPAGVLGYQISHKLLHDRFMEITSKTKKCDDCIKTCASDEQDCYVLDNSGYVILSENYNETGKFFGELEGAIMEEMINNDIYQKVNVFDLQGVCYSTIFKSSSSNFLLTPAHYIGLILQWLGAQLLWLLFQTNLSFLWADPGVKAEFFDDEYDYYNSYDRIGEDYMEQIEVATQKPRRPHKGVDPEEDEYFNKPRKPVPVEINFSCDRLADLYVLQQQKFIRGDSFVANGPSENNRPYYVQRIPHSNLIMVVVNTMYPSRFLKLHAGARPIAQTGQVKAADSCHKLQLADLPRRRLEGCYTYDPLEFEVEACGRTVSIEESGYLIMICSILLYFKFNLS